MKITIPLVKLIPLWIADSRVKGQLRSKGKPYAEGTLTSYKRKAKKYLSLDCDLSTESFEQHLKKRSKEVDSRTVNFEETALNVFFNWLLDYDLIEEHPNPKHKSMQEKVEHQE